MEGGQGKRALTRERARISLVVTNAAALLDVLDPLPNIGMVLAREIALHELCMNSAAPSSAKSAASALGKRRDGSGSTSRRINLISGSL